MINRRLLLQSVSSAALLTTSTVSGLADESHAIPSGYTVSLEGAYLNGSLQGVDKLGSLDSSISLGTFRGFNGALTLNKKISEIWDIQGNIAYAGFLDQKTSTSSYSSSGGATYLDEAVLLVVMHFKPPILKSAIVPPLSPTTSSEYLADCARCGLVNLMMYPEPRPIWQRWQ